MTQNIDNNGIGALYATFFIHKTGSEYDLDESNIGDAVSLSGNNEISHGAGRSQLLGRLAHVDGNGLATVQIRGVIRLKLAPGQSVPNVGNSVVVDDVGKVYRSPMISDYPIVVKQARGLVIAVYNQTHCDVLL